MVALDQETLDLFARSVRGVLDSPDADRTAALDEMGWRDILVTDARAVVPLVFRLHGERRARSAVLDDVAVESMNAGSVEFLEELAQASYVHPQPGQRAAGHFDGGRLAVDGLALRDPRDGRTVTIAHGDDGGTYLVRAPANAFEWTRIEGLDPSLALVRVTGTAPAGEFEPRDATSPIAAEPACRRALAYELVGLGSAMLDLTAEYAGARTQFGQPIGAFQAVKHRLADVLVALQAAEVAADESWNGDTMFATAAAKCLAGRAFRLAAENCLQVMGAIGFTLEHELHRFILRGTVLDVLYGSARELRIELGRALLANRRVPRPGAL
jgi:Acyl-CoA dehydrogenase, C-terminal domain